MGFFNFPFLLGGDGERREKIVFLVWFLRSKEWRRWNKRMRVGGTNFF